CLQGIRRTSKAESVPILMSTCSHLFFINHGVGNMLPVCDDCGVDRPGDCPKHGPLTHVKDSEVFEDGKVFLVDGRPLDSSNWMRYVNCAASPQEQNLVAFTRHGNIYYRTPKAVGAGEELLVWYGAAFARELGLLGKPRGSGPSAKEDGDSEARPQPVFSCDTCGEPFYTPDCLEKHRRHNHLQRPERRHRCAHCPYSSDRK
ncbi:hypothetical protein V5799_009780, partial [Amblyomma americanum]